MTIKEISHLKIPFVGVGCIVSRAGKFLLARNHGGGWGPPGGHLDFGEDPATCAARETLEETGVRVSKIEFVAITNDLLVDTGKHYVTIWMQGEPDQSPALVADPKEIAEVGWFAQSEFPQPLAVYFENLLARRCLPPAPANLPFAMMEAARA